MDIGQGTAHGGRKPVAEKEELDWTGCPSMQETGDGLNPLTVQVGTPLGLSLVEHQSAEIVVIHEVAHQTFEGQGLERSQTQFDLDTAGVGIEAQNRLLVGEWNAEIVGVFPELHRAAHINPAAESLMVIVPQPSIGVDLVGQGWTGLSLAKKGIRRVACQIATLVGAFFIVPVEVRAQLGIGRHRVGRRDALEALNPQVQVEALDHGLEIGTARWAHLRKTANPQHIPQQRGGEGIGGRTAHETRVTVEHNSARYPEPLEGVGQDLERMLCVERDRGFAVHMRRTTLVYDIESLQGIGFLLRRISALGAQGTEVDFPHRARWWAQEWFMGGTTERHNLLLLLQHPPHARRRRRARPMFPPQVLTDSA